MTKVKVEVEQPSQASTTVWLTNFILICWIGLVSNNPENTYIISGIALLLLSISAYAKRQALLEPLTEGDASDELTIWGLAVLLVFVNEGISTNWFNNDQSLVYVYILPIAFVALICGFCSIKPKAGPLSLCAIGIAFGLGRFLTAIVGSYSLLAVITPLCKAVVDLWSTEKHYRYSGHMLLWLALVSFSLAPHLDHATLKKDSSTNFAPPSQQSFRNVVPNELSPNSFVSNKKSEQTQRVQQFEDAPTAEPNLMSDQNSHGASQVLQSNAATNFPTSAGITTYGNTKSSIAVGDVPINTFSLGSTKQEVQSVQGTPTSIYGDNWNYEYSSVTFQNHLVTGYSNISRNLKVCLSCSENSAAGAVKDSFSMGSSRQDVLGVQGTPTAISGDTWNYDYSTVNFQNNNVSGFSNISHNLKVALGRNENSAAALRQYFSVGSIKQEVLDVQGNPTAILGDIWNYDYSTVTFQNNMVTDFSNISHNLKIALKRYSNSSAATKNCFYVGSSKQDVLDIQGTPTAILGETWNYEYSSVTFLNNEVQNYSNISKNLKIGN